MTERTVHFVVGSGHPLALPTACGLSPSEALGVTTDPVLVTCGQCRDTPVLTVSDRDEDGYFGYTNMPEPVLTKGGEHSLPTPEAHQRYFLARDQSGHWYLVPAERRSEWNEWNELSEDDPRVDNPPEFAEALGSGPPWIEFERPTKWEPR